MLASFTLNCRAVKCLAASGGIFRYIDFPDSVAKNPQNADATTPTDCHDGVFQPVGFAKKITPDSTSNLMGSRARACCVHYVLPRIDYRGDWGGPPQASTVYPKRSARREVGLTTTADAVDRIVAMVIYRRRSHLSGNPLLCAYCSIIGSRTSGF
ncbi:hypothetical protein KC339_g114 [Hortaea werneckii]|nr:hypothetical protein KC339_g114 [Hortaea werneckii]